MGIYLLIDSFHWRLFLMTKTGWIKIGERFVLDDQLYKIIIAVFMFGVLRVYTVL